MFRRDGDAEAVDRRRVMGAHRAIVTEETKAQAIFGTPAVGGPSGAHGHPVCIEVGHSVGNAAQGDGVRLGDDLLATTEALAASRRMAPAAPGAALGAAWGEATGLLAGRGRQLLDSRRGGGKKSGPNPTDRRRAGSKHHLLTDAQGVPLSLILTGANRHDVTQLLPLVQAVPPVAGRRGAPKRKPALVQADRAYHSEPLRRELAEQGIDTQIARRGAPHGSGLGKTRWVVERTIAWLHQFRRLRVRYERLPSIHEAFLMLGACMICWRFVKTA
jgi:transposase